MVFANVDMLWSLDLVFMVHDLNCFSEVFDCFVNVRKHIFLIGSVNSTSTTIYTYSVCGHGLIA